MPLPYASMNRVKFSQKVSIWPPHRLQGSPSKVPRQAAAAPSDSNKQTPEKAVKWEGTRVVSLHEMPQSI